MATGESGRLADDSLKCKKAWKVRVFIWWYGFETTSEDACLCSPPFMRFPYKCNKNKTSLS